MNRVESVRAAWLACACIAGGCATLPPGPPEAEPAAGTRPPQPESARAPAAPEPAPAPRPAPRPPPPPTRVLVLSPPQPDDSAAWIPALEAGLDPERFEVRRFPADRIGRAVDAAASRPGAGVVVAIGSAATRAAVGSLDLPIVFCQVSDTELPQPEGVFGIATLPPLELQLRAWRQLDPSLRAIGLVLGRDEHQLATRARRAAEAVGLSLEVQLAASDREATYRVRRMASQIDGLWLLPDNTVLSPRALREMLGHADAHGLRSLAFTPGLLAWGALASVSATPEDLARKLANVVERLAEDRADEVPAITPLSELEIRVNRDAAARLGLSPPGEAWIVRQPPES